MDSEQALRAQMTPCLTLQRYVDQRLANCALDTAVSQGPSVAATLYQQFGHDIRAFQLARLLRYAAIGKTQFFHSWFERALDV